MIEGLMSGLLNTVIAYGLAIVGGGVATAYACWWLALRASAEVRRRGR